MTTNSLANTSIDTSTPDSDIGSQDRWSNDGGQISDPDLQRAQATNSLRGVIRQLKHLSAGTDVPSTHLVAARNGTGYGYISTSVGDVFFDASAVTNVHFDQLARGMTVEFTLDRSPFLRTSRIVVLPVESGGQRGSDPESQEIV